MFPSQIAPFDTTVTKSSEQPSLYVCGVPIAHYHILDTLMTVVPLIVAAAICLPTILALIFCKKLRRQHNIFAFNIVLADFVCVIVIMTYKWGQFMESCERDCSSTKIYTASLSTCTIVSMTSILLVALYTLITIRIDPFGTHRIVTTPRCIILCMLTWVMSAAVYIPSAILLDYAQLTKVVASLQTIALASTGLCYALTYRAVSKVRLSTAMSKERKDENKRVLRSFAMVFGTTLFFLVIPVLGYFVEALWRNSCFRLLFTTSSSMNLVANSLVYWWRLKEFRSMLHCSRKQRIVIPY